MLQQPARYDCRGAVAILASMNADDFLAMIAAALGPYAESPANPNGGCGYYVKDEWYSYAVCWGNNSDVSEFKTAAEAIEAAKEFRVEAE